MNNKSLIDSIIDILINKNHPNPTAWTDHEWITIAKGSTPDFERIYVNRYWRQFLGSLPVDTSIARFCLDDHNDERDYLNSFRDIVSIIIVENS